MVAGTSRESTNIFSFKRPKWQKLSWWQMRRDLTLAGKLPTSRKIFLPPQGSLPRFVSASPTSLASENDDSAWVAAISQNGRSSDRQQGQACRRRAPRHNLSHFLPCKLPCPFSTVPSTFLMSSGPLFLTTISSYWPPNSKHVF